jgi:hypothetical protein
MGDHRSRPIVDVDWIANYWRSLTLSRRQLRDTQKKRKDLGHTSVAKFCRFFRLVFEVLLREREPEPEAEAAAAAATGVE